MHSLGPRPETLAEWAAAGLELPDLLAMRRFRLDRLRAELARSECDAALLYDPLNIRYATDTTNMSVWTMHNAVRYVLVAAAGPVVLFEYSDGEFLSAHSEVIDEIRPATSLLPFYVGGRIDEIAGRWADEIVELMEESSRSGSRRLAVDTLSLDAIRALESRDVDLVSGQQILENARLVKGPEEIKAMRCATDSCQRDIEEMRAIFEPGVTEVELWAKLQQANFLRFGEWIETRLLASGERTNPWYQEASRKVVAAGEIMAFDTDLIGAYGMCIDISRSWLCGGGRPNPDQADVYARALESIQANIPLFVPGATYRDITERCTYSPTDEFNGYTVVAHGVGICDEYPSIYMRELWDRTGFDGVVEVGNVFSVEAFVGRRSGGEGVKLEQQLVVTESGPELLDEYPLGLL
jgi:Xaa-Pro aminopeptidase